MFVNKYYKFKNECFLLLYNTNMFKIEDFKGNRILTSNFINDENVIAFFTTRDMPLKVGDRQDLIELVSRSKRLLCDELGITYGSLIIPVQTHSSNIGIIRKSKEEFENTDALITNVKKIAIALNFADCVPIIFYDKIKKVIACAHAGWRGTAAQISVKTVKKMQEEFACNPADITALIGPAIGKCCFEIKQEVMEKLKNSISEKYHNTNLFDENHADLKLINKVQLSDCGLSNIDVCDYCTSCNNELFFSYRKEQGKCARHSAVIMLKGE